MQVTLNVTSFEIQNAYQSQVIAGIRYILQ